MSLTVSWEEAAGLNWRPISLEINLRQILRNSGGRRLAEALAEVLALLVVSAGLLTLFLGLSVL